MSKLECMGYVIGIKRYKVGSHMVMEKVNSMLDALNVWTQAK